ncbi:transposase [Paraburkholderia youngii]|uniref:IS66 family insertion sequence element accessory protein TnpB n=1 Tax=Paraburkholderia youngii TaxID=2782701 RepID=UPI003D25C682
MDLAVKAPISANALPSHMIATSANTVQVADLKSEIANLLRKWITKYLLEREKGISPAPQEPVAEHHETAPAAEVIDGVAIDLLGPCKAASPTKTSSAFVPVVSVPPALLPEGSALARAPMPSSPSMALALHVRLPNAVEFDIADATIDELATVVQMLGRMPCSGSTRI